MSNTEVQKVFNPFYAPAVGDDGDDSYRYAAYKPSFPKISWPPLEPVQVRDRGHDADPEKKELFAAASKVINLTPALGTELRGISLSKLTDRQKDELALLVAERGVVFFREQNDFGLKEQLELGRYFGPLHKHATTPVPKKEGLHEVHVIYNDASRRPDPSAFSKSELWHSDVTYELQPPAATILKLYTAPEVGGDTHWSSGYSLYSSLSKPFQKYLEGLSAVHSAVAQAEGARAAGTHVRRTEIETVHPIVRVHPVTGWKSVYVNPGFTRRIVGVPKSESDWVLRFLFSQIGENPDFQVRFRWEEASVAIWDNRVMCHSATFDFFPQRRHALRVTPHGERPMSVERFEREFGRKAVDRQEEIWARLGVDLSGPGSGIVPAAKPTYND